MIPTYGVQAHGGKIISLDDQLVVKDLAALDATGGSAFTAYLLSAILGPAKGGGYQKLRRVVQRVPHDGAVTVTVTPYRDGAETGQIITRTLAASDNPTVEAPLSLVASIFALKLALSSFDAPASLGSAEYVTIPKRSVR